MLKFDRKQQNSAKQLSFNQKINLKKEEKGYVKGQRTTGDNRKSSQGSKLELLGNKVKQYWTATQNIYSKRLQVHIDVDK